MAAQAVEGRRFKWLPGRRRDLEGARELERVADDAYAVAESAAAEHSHAARPFLAERVLQAADARQYERWLELKSQRVLSRARARDLGREL